MQIDINTVATASGGINSLRAVGVLKAQPSYNGCNSCTYSPYERNPP